VLEGANGLKDFRKPPMGCRALGWHEVGTEPNAKMIAECCEFHFLRAQQVMFSRTVHIRAAMDRTGIRRVGAPYSGTRENEGSMRVQGDAVSNEVYYPGWVVTNRWN